MALPGQPELFDLGGIFIPATADLAGVDLAGLYVPDLGFSKPSLSDQPAVCNQAPQSLIPADKQTACATAETLCVARGPRCTGGSCVRSFSSCAIGAQIAPQRKPGSGSTEAYCPYTDDICCPPPAPPDAAVPVDAAGSDAGAVDAAVPVDAAVSDAALPG